MKKIFTVLIALFLVASVSAFAACGNSETEREMMVISREAGSGTRGAFEEILGIKATEIYYDLIGDKTNNVMTAVANNKWSIGYVSIGSLNDTVKAISVGGAAPTAANVLNSSYTIARPFLMVHKKDATLSAIAQDFKLFLASSQAQEIISARGYVATVQNAQTYTAPAGMSGTLSINGSTSVGPVMVALAAKYVELNSGVSVNDITIDQTGSGTGITTATAGNCDFGMSSRELKESEEAALTKITVCMDGIAVIVNKENQITNISLENLIKIYKGEIRKFSEM